MNWKQKLIFYMIALGVVMILTAGAQYLQHLQNQEAEHNSLVNAKAVESFIDHSRIPDNNLKP